MVGTRTLYQSRENISARLRASRESVLYEAVLTFRDSGKNPVGLNPTFVPPQPFALDVPETKAIKADSVTAVYAKPVKFLTRLRAELRQLSVVRQEHRMDRFRRFSRFPLRRVLPPLSAMITITPMDSSALQAAV